MTEDTDFPGVSVDTSDPEHVSEFRTKDHYPDEVAEQWDDIRAGKTILVDDTGHIVEDLHDADRPLHPDYMMAGIPSSLSGIGPNDLPPVTHTPVGKPEFDDSGFAVPYTTWIDPDTAEFMISDGETTAVFVEDDDE